MPLDIHGDAALDAVNGQGSAVVWFVVTPAGTLHDA